MSFRPLFEERLGPMFRKERPKQTSANIRRSLRHFQAQRVGEAAIRAVAKRRVRVPPPIPQHTWHGARVHKHTPARTGTRARHERHGTRSARASGLAGRQASRPAGGQARANKQTLDKQANKQPSKQNKEKHKHKHAHARSPRHARTHAPVPTPPRCALTRMI